MTAFNEDSRLAAEVLENIGLPTYAIGVGLRNGDLAVVEVALVERLVVAGEGLKTIEMMFSNSRLDAFREALLDAKAAGFGKKEAVQ